MVLIDIFTPFLACLIPPARKYKISYCRYSSSSLLLLFFSWEKLTRVIDQEKLKSPIIRWDNLLLMIPLNIYGESVNSESKSGTIGNDYDFQ